MLCANQGKFKFNYAAQINWAWFSNSRTREKNKYCFPANLLEKSPEFKRSSVGSDSKDQLVRAEALMTFVRSKEGHPRNNRGNLKRALFSAKKKRRLTRVNADHVPAYAKPFLLFPSFERQGSPLVIFPNTQQYASSISTDSRRIGLRRPNATLFSMF